MTTVYPSSDGYFQQDNAPCHKAQIISDWFLEHDNKLTLLKLPPQSPDLNPIEHLWDVVEWEIRIMDVQPTNLQELRDAIMSIWTKISEECFQHLVKSMTQRIKAVLKPKGGPTRYKQGVPNKVASECIFDYLSNISHRNFKYADSSACSFQRWKNSMGKDTLLTFTRAYVGKTASHSNCCFGENWQISFCRGRQTNPHI